MTRKYRDNVITNHLGNEMSSQMQAAAALPRKYRRKVTDKNKRAGNWL